MTAKGGGRLLRALATVGHAMALIGAVDPLEGSPLVALGCVLVALAAWRARVLRALLVWRVAVAGMALMGVTALWVISYRGGVGGEAGLHPAWSVLMLPYAAALVAAFSGPAAPPWVAWGGGAVGAGYLAIAGIILLHPRPNSSPEVAALLGSLGLALLAACVARIVMRRRSGAA
jgi:hypothetical protein